MSLSDTWKVQIKAAKRSRYAYSKNTNRQNKKELFVQHSKTMSASKELIEFAILRSSTKTTGEITMNNTIETSRIPWNKGKLVGQKLPLKLQEIWAIRIRLQLAEKTRDLALFNLAIDSKLRGCDLVKLKVADISHGSTILKRAMIMQQKTKQPVQFEITEQTRKSINDLITKQDLKRNDFLFKSRFHDASHMSTRQYARIVESWVTEIGLDPSDYGTHSMRRTKVSLIYRRTHNLRAIQLLLGHTKLESTVRYLGIEVDDALEIAERTEI